MNTSVVSAAIIEGSLIIGLSDGSIINCGFVQGPQGLSGPQGPMGATGDSGTDGNTIHTVAGTPGNEMGTDGDYAIDNINWRIYGPRSGGVWGKAKSMLPDADSMIANGRIPASGGGSMGGSGSGGGPVGTVYTNTVQLTNPTRTLLSSTANYKIIPNAPSGSSNQQDANQWAFGSVFDNFDAAIPVATGVLPPSPLPGFTDSWDGRLWFDSNEDELTLYIYNNGVWIPAAPPISLDGINATIDAALITQSEILTRVSEGETIQTALVSETANLQNQIDDLGVTKGSVARYKIKATSIGAASRNGELYVSAPAAADVQAMSFAPFDLNGQPTKPCTVGDIVELVEAVALASIGEVSRYRVLSGDSNALTVEYLSGTNNFEVDETQEVYIYPQNEAGATKDYVDAQDQLLDDKKLNLTGGTLTNSLAFNRGNKAAPQSGIEPNSGTSDTNIYVFNNGQMRLRSTPTADINDRTGSHIVLDPNGGAPETKIYHVVTPTDSGMAANKEYVDDAIGAIPDNDLSSYLKNEGSNDLPNDTDWKVKQQNASGSNKTLLQIKEGDLGLYNLKEPTQSHHAATKGYVDANAGSTAFRPPGLRFQYQSGSAFPASGTFNWFTSGGSQRMKINATSQDFGWGTNTENVDVTYNEGHTFSIWLTVTSNGVTSWKLKTTGTYNRLDFHDNDVLVYISYNTPLNDVFGTTIDYYLTLSGLF